MREYLKSRAIILSGRDLGESDRLVGLLSRDFGRLSAVAKGAKRSTRRFAGALELFSLVEMGAVDSGRDLLRLDSCDLLDPYPAIRSDVRRYGAACYLCELARELFPEREPAEAAFGVLAWALAGLDAGGDFPWERVAALRLIGLAGFAPHLSGCLRCGASPAGRPMHFSPGRGGVLCPGCAAGEPAAVEVSAGTLGLLGEAARLEPAKLTRLRFSRLALEESEALLTALLRHTLRRELKSKRFLEEVR